MTEATQFTVGAEASCTDGACGGVSRVVVDPIAHAVTRLVVEPLHRQGSVGLSRSTLTTSRPARCGSAARWRSSVGSIRLA
jgi:hypothetical protein